MKSIAAPMTALVIAASLMTSRATAVERELPKPRYGSWGVDLAAMDRSVKPGNDFAKFVNGIWSDRAVIPDDRSSVGVSEDIRSRVEQQIDALIAALRAKPYDSLTDEEKKLRDLYESYVDQTAIDAAGLAPAKRDLDFLAGLSTLEDVAMAMGRPELGLGGPFPVEIALNPRDTTRYDVFIVQPAMARHGALADDKALAAARDAYQRHIARMLALVGIQDAERRASVVYELEYALALAKQPDAANRKRGKSNIRVSFSALEALLPEFPWETYLKAKHVPLSGPHGERQLFLLQPSTVRKIGAIFAATPVAVWRDFLTVYYLDRFGEALPHGFDEAIFEFYDKTLDGMLKPQPRTAQAVDSLNSRTAFAIGKLYVKKYFPPASEARIVALVNNLIKAFDEELHQLTWMTPVTREEALAKLHKMSVQIGYPAHWRDYSALVIKRGDLLGNLQRSNAFSWDLRLAHLDRPVDRTEWSLAPQSVNAGSSAQFNYIIFPAAILQPPYFDPDADDAVNYGAIGAVIGHEITHDFDDWGARFDAAGVSRTWWKAADRSAFGALTKKLGTQYNAYEPLPGLHVNGARTMNENVADNGGAAIALKAYYLSLGGRAAPVLDGFTGDQRFYLGLAQAFRSKSRDKALRAQVLSDVHAPDEIRIIGVTRNQDEWYAAFGVQPGDKYYLPPDRRVHFWGAAAPARQP